MDEDVIFEGLSHQRRRYVLQVLSEEGQTTVEAIATQLAELESASDTSEKDHQECVYISLCHDHLPALADVGIIEYDRETERVTPTGKASQLYGYLELFE